VRLGGAWTTFRGKRLKVWRSALAGPSEVPLAPGELTLVPGEPGVRAGTSQGALVLLEVQPEGKSRVEATAWRNGARPAPDERLGT
jgi:methionyl-tRNA formyltransferase